MDNSSRCSGFRLLRAALISMALTVSLAAVAGEVIYTWTDDEGVRHFSAQPPEDREYRVFEVLGSPASELPQTARQPTDAMPPAALTEIQQAQPDPEVVRERCEQARQNLDLLRQDRPAMLRQDDGDPIPMDDAARQQMIEEVEDFMAQWC